MYIIQRFLRVAPCGRPRRLLRLQAGGGGRGEDAPRESVSTSPISTHPTNNTLLIVFRLSSDAVIFVNEHRLGIQIGAKTCKNKCAMCTRCNRASILHATVAGWASAEKKKPLAASARKNSLLFLLLVVPPPPPLQVRLDGAHKRGGRRPGRLRGQGQEALHRAVAHLRSEKEKKNMGKACDEKKKKKHTSELT